MGFMDFMFGKKEKMMTPSLMTGGQTDVLNQLLGMLSGQGGGGEGLFGQGGQYLSDMLSGSPEAMQKFEAPHMRQFSEQTVPGLAERFSGMGSGSQSSSAFGQQMGQAGAGLSENLAAMRGQLQQGAMGQLSGLMGQGLGAKQFENIFRPETFGFMGQLGAGLGQGIGSAGSMYGMAKLGKLMGLLG